MTRTAYPAKREGATSFGRALARVEAHSRSLAWALLALLALMVALHAWVWETFTVPSTSMMPTLAQGDRILVNKTGAVRRGDVVVFSGEGSMYQIQPRGSVRQRINSVFDALGFRIDETDYVKRVIGVGGDRVQVDHAGVLRVNGRTVSEPYLGAHVRKASAVPFSITVPAGTYFVMGDNRNNSDDSRNHLGDPGGGFVPENKIVGILATVYWSAS